MRSNHMKHSARLGLLAVTAATVISGAALAQDTTAAGVLAVGLNNPRHILYRDGVTYIAQAGTGGDEEVQGNYGPAMTGLTASVSTIGADMTVTPLITDLPSIDEGGEVHGASAVEWGADLLWTAGDAAAGSEWVIGADPETGEIVIDLNVFAAEEAQNPDGEIIDSNPVDLAYDVINEVLYIADAGANTVWMWTTDMGEDLAPFATWSADENPVPTAVETDFNGNVWVGFLTGFPFPEGGSRVEVYAPDGTLTETYDGFTTIVDVLFANDTVYAVQFGTFGDMGWNPFSGSVVDVLSGDVYAEGLNLPYGLTMGEDSLWIVTNSAYMRPGAGVITTLETAAMMGAMPAATPEAGG
jgi:hypothetical protein